MLLKQPSVLGATQLLTGANVSYDVIIDDLQRNIDAENPPVDATQQLQFRKGEFDDKYVSKEAKSLSCERRRPDCFIYTCWLD